MKTVSLPETGTTTDTRREKLYHVIILNDDEHSYEYVIEMSKRFRNSILFRVAHTLCRHHGSSIIVTCPLKKPSGSAMASMPMVRTGACPQSRGSVAPWLSRRRQWIRPAALKTN